MSVQRWRVWVAVLFVSAASGWILRDYIAAEWHARDAEREIIALASKIPNNATREQVAESFAAGSYRHLTPIWHGLDEQWFTTPSRIGGSDWILIVVFERGHAVAVRVRTADNSGGRPDEAPLDRTLR